MSDPGVLRKLARAVAPKRGVPSSPGTAPVPEGMARRYHYTDEQNADAIEREGILMRLSNGARDRDPVAVWSTPDNPYKYGPDGNKALVEFYENPAAYEGNPYAQSTDVRPEQILGVHMPWHKHYRYAVENNIPSSTLRSIGAPEYTLAADALDALTPTLPLTNKAEGGPVEMDTGGGVLRKLIRAYHGSPYAFDKFDPTKIGSGEGAQAYGYGHYFADKEDIARGYRDKLSAKDERLLLDGKYIPIKKSGGNSDDRAFDRMLQNARQNYFDNANPNIHPDDASEVLRNAFVGHPEGRLFADRLKGQTISYQPGGGHMYDVNLGVNPQDLLNWDKPLREQPSLPYNFGAQRRPPDWTGRDLYHNWDTPERTAKQMLEAGIPGIRYLDGFSRGAGEGTSNYVMFPGTEDLININRRFEQGGPVDTPTEGEGGIYGAPDSMFNTPESLAAALYPQHNTAYGGGGKVLRKAGQLARDALLGDLPEYKKGEETYLRFGKWPENERSQNFITGDRERGVSVFGMEPSGLPESPDLIDTFPYRMSDHLSSTHADDPLHLVQGRPVGEGYDGEPLIQDITRLPTTWHRPQRWTLPAQKSVGTPSTDWSQFESFVKPYAGDYADGGPVHMEVGGILRRASRLGDMMNEITNRHGASQGRRFEQASDSANLDRYSDDALRQTFGRSDTGLYTTMPPGRFEDFAARIPDRLLSERPYYKWNHHPDADMLSPNQQSYDEYMRVLKAASEYGGGLDQVPYLKLNKGLPFNDVVSHEGRHRMRMFDEQGDKNSLVQLLPTGGYGLFDDRVERLMKSYFLHGKDTPYMPEKSDVYDSFRPMVQFPNPVFAEGGEVEMDKGGWLRRLAQYADAPSKHIDDYQWKPMSEVGERLGQIDAIPPHVENFGGFMQEQAQRAANEGLTPRDLLKAFGISRGSIQRSALPTDSIRATGLDIPGNAPTIRPEGAFATWMGTKPGQSWLDKGQSGIVDFDAINDAQQRLAPFGKSGDLAQFLQWGPENLPGREGRLSELVDRARTPGNSSPEEWKDAVGDLFGIGLAKRGFFSAMLGRGDQPVFDARQIDLNVPKGNYAGKYERRGNTEGGDEIMARLAARQNALGIGVPKDLMPFQQYLTHHTTWDKLGNEATTHQDLIDSLRGHAEGGPVEMQVGGADKIKDAVGFLRRSIMPHAREKSMVPPNRDIESRYWDHKKPSDLDTITADYGVNHLPVDVPTMKIEDIKGGRVFAIPHDRSATDLLLGGYNGNTFANPVTSPGGPLYAFGRNPEAVTASGEKVIKNLHESALRAADEGKTPYLAPWLMGPHGVDFSTHMNEAVVQSLPFLKVPTEKRKEVDALLSGVFKDFPGIDHKDLAQYLNSITGTTRRDLPKLLDTGAMVNAGLDVGGLRAALTEPSLLHAPYGSSGAAISRIDPSMSPTMFGYPHHPSYPWQLRGTPVGGLDPLVPSQILYPDIYRTLPPDTQLGPKGRPVNNRRAFEMKSMLGDVYQDVNDEVINGVNEYQEYMRKIRGRKEGGTVEDQYHPIWQQSFQSGGQPKSDTRDWLREKPEQDTRDWLREKPEQDTRDWKLARPDTSRTLPEPVTRGWYRAEPDTSRTLSEPDTRDLLFRTQRFAGGGQPDTLPVQWDQDYDYENDPRDRSTVSGNLADALYGGRITPTPEERRAFREERAARRAEHPEGVYSTDPVRAVLGLLQKQRAGWQADQAEMYPGESSPWQRAGDQLGHMGRTLAHDVTGGLSDKLIAALSPGDYSANVPREEAATRSSRDQLDPYVRGPLSVLPFALSPAQQIKQYAMTVGSNLAEPAHGAIDWARKQFDKSMLGMVRPTAEGVSGALSPAFTRPMWDKSYGYAHGGSVEDQYHPIWSQNFAEGGSAEHAPDFGDNFEGIPGLGSLADVAGGLFAGEDVDLHDVLGETFRAIGTAIGAYAGVPGVGGAAGEFVGNLGANLIEPDNGEDTGQDAMRIGSGFAQGAAMNAFMADGGPVKMAFGGNFSPRGGGSMDSFTEPGMPFFGVGVPEFDVDPLRTNPQVARDAAERNSMLRQVQADSQKGLAQQMKPKDSGGGGGGMGDIMGMVKMAAQFAPMFLADGGSIPEQNGEQPWMYGGGALMARGGYLRSHGGMNG